MSIDLHDYEAGRKYDGHYKKDLKKLQKRLERIQVAHAMHKRPAIIALEGWDAAGKGGIIQRMTAEWDPRFYEVWPISAPTPPELAHHFLWRFWKRLPEAGDIAVFDRSWYGRVLVERVEGFASEPDWRRGYDEINAFEAQQIEGGTTVVKLFVHVTQAEQDRRLKARLEEPWKHWKTGLEDYRNRSKRDAYLRAMHDMFEHTDTKKAPWTVIDGNDKKAARIAAMTAVADALEAHVAMEPPPIDPEVEKVAKAALGLDSE